KRKPIYLAFPQAVPQKVVIDRDTCIEFKSGKCKKTCIEVCGERHAIDFKQKETVEEIEIGAIILATGFKTFAADRNPSCGYGQYPNVYTSLEVERLINASGPTGGEVVLRDGKKPKSVGIIHCVGSRDATTNRWCSKVCCMYSLKLAHLIKEQEGNYKALRRYRLLKRVLKEMGIEEERFHLEWISAAEADRVRSAINQMVEKVRALGPLNREVKDVENAFTEEVLV